MPISAMPTSDQTRLKKWGRPRTNLQFVVRPASEAAERGFTLIELMVVVFLIGLFSAAVIVNLPDPRGSLIREAEQFAARTAAARDEAVISARAIRVIVDRQGYRFEMRKRGLWSVIEGKPLRPARWQDETIADQGLIYFDSTGMVEEPYRLRIARGADQISIWLDQDGAVRVVG